MPRAADNSRGATGRETDATIAAAKAKGAKAESTEGLTTLEKAFYHAQHK